MKYIFSLLILVAFAPRHLFDLIIAIWAVTVLVDLIDILFNKVIVTKVKK